MERTIKTAALSAVTALGLVVGGATIATAATEPSRPGSRSARWGGAISCGGFNGSVVEGNRAAGQGQMWLIIGGEHRSYNGNLQAGLRRVFNNSGAPMSWEVGGDRALSGRAGCTISPSMPVAPPHIPPELGITFPVG